MDDPSLAPRALVWAYERGLFPMDREGARGPIALYSADPRALMPIEGFRIPASVRRGLRRRAYDIRVDAAFDEVVAGCAAGRPRGQTWLTPRLARAYGRLHRAGLAHSVEAWDGARLVGGLFGVALGGLYSSESMFHTAPDAGSAALVGAAALLAAAGFELWDIQMTSPHTLRFGAVEVPAAEYERRLRRALAASPAPVLSAARPRGAV
ncbi:MAG: leucyl/phenylalanyl-tRNA--protein transferase [Thermoleophilia bacterium]